MLELTEREKANYWRKVVRANREGFGEGCWIWLASMNASGYPQFSVGGKATEAWRVALTLAGRNFAREDRVAHSCGNRWCMNPDHMTLAPGTRRKARIRFTKEQIDTILEWGGRGLAYADLARMFHCSASGVYNAAKRERTRIEAERRAKIAQVECDKGSGI